MHRDIKSQNVVVNVVDGKIHGRSKLWDFGDARKATKTNLAAEAKPFVYGSYGNNAIYGTGGIQQLGSGCFQARSRCLELRCPDMRDSNARFSSRYSERASRGKNGKRRICGESH